MSLLVSDYDGTILIDSLFRDSYIPEGTISNIKNYMGVGNKFMIATARSYDSIIKEVEKYNIPYNYISVLNGCIIYDNFGDVIFSKDMIDLDIKSLYQQFPSISSIEPITDNDKLLYYIVKSRFFRHYGNFIRFLNNSDLSIQSWFLNSYNIVHPKSNKIDSIKFIQDLLNIDDSSVITVGDSDDDLQMIKNYYSYGILKPFSDSDVLENCNNKVKSLNNAFNHIKNI